MGLEGAGEAGTAAMRAFLSADGRLARVVLAAVCLSWAGILALILQHPIFVTNDSLSNYGHVWYVSERFWGGHGIPYRMPVLGHGDALAFPYAFIPWFSAALVYPLLGDWAVTLWLVLGFAGLVAAMWWAFPELRAAWPFAALLVNPALVESPLLGQLPFVWAAALLFAAIALWRRGRPVAAAVVLGLSQATHPAVLMPIAGMLIVGRLWREPDRGRLLRLYGLSLLIAAPAVWMVLASPVVEDTSLSSQVKNLIGTVSLRSLAIAAPFAFLALRPLFRGYWPAALIAGLIALNLAFVPLRHDDFAWRALTRTPDESLQEFIQSPLFQAGATYRILRSIDGKIGMYDLIRAGANLDSEFFPESINRRSWASTDDYAKFLVRRDVDFVIIYGLFDRRDHTNEHALLEALTTTPVTGPDAVCAALTLRTDGYDVYEIRHGSCQSQARAGSAGWSARV